MRFVLSVAHPDGSTPRFDLAAQRNGDSSAWSDAGQAGIRSDQSRGFDLGLSPVVTLDPGTAAFAVVSHRHRGDPHTAALTEEADLVDAGQSSVQSIFRIGDGDIDLSRNLGGLTSPCRIASTAHQD